MTSDNLNRLREIQTRIESAASKATTREELMNYRALWGEIQVVLDSEACSLPTDSQP